MSTKAANIIFILFIIALGIGYGISALSLQDDGGLTTLGPGYFPTLLAIILIILSVISLIQTLIKKENSKVEIPHFMLIVLTIGMIGLLIFSWSHFGYFYIHLFLFLFVLISAYQFRAINMKKAMKNGAVALLITVVTYITFNILLNMNL